MGGKTHLWGISKSAPSAVPPNHLLLIVHEQCLYVHRNANPIAIVDYYFSYRLIFFSLIKATIVPSSDIWMEILPLPIYPTSATSIPDRVFYPFSFLPFLTSFWRPCRELKCFPRCQSDKPFYLFCAHLMFLFTFSYIGKFNLLSVTGLTPLGAS